MYVSPGNLPDQKCVDCSEEEIAVSRFFPGSGNIVQEPFDLGTGEICVRNQTGGSPDVLGISPRNEVVYDGSGSPILPDDGIVNGLARPLVPNNCGLSLVSYPDGGNLVLAP